MPEIVLNTLHELTHLTHTTTLEGQYYYCAYLTDKGRQEQRLRKFHKITQLKCARVKISNPGNLITKSKFQLIKGMAEKEDK